MLAWLELSLVKRLNATVVGGLCVCVRVCVV